MPMTRAGRDPQAEGPVDMNPGPMSLRDRNQDLERVIRADVNVAGLQKHDSWRRRIGLQRLFKGLWPQAALIVRGKGCYLRASEAEQTDRSFKGSVALGAGQYPNRGRSEQTLLLDVPPPPRQERMARRREAGCMRHLTPTHQREAGVPRKAEEIF